MTDTQAALPLLLADTPAKAEEDLLGFQPHADRLAAMLLKQQFPDASFVVGIEGEWGEGKSTFINCLKQRFEQAKQVHGEIPPAMVEFNPWWFENPEKTASNLLETIINGRDLCDVKARRALTHLLNGLNHVNPWLEKLLSNPVVLAPFFGASAVAAYKSETWFGVAAAAVVALVCHLGLQWLARRHVWSESLAGLKQKAAAELKSEKMKGQKQIVIIDDLDRLSHEEIRQVFRAVKGVLDLPNIIYVIAYDRTIVASALDHVHEGRGEAYMEKIIQYPYLLPRPHAMQKLAYNKKVIAQYLTDLPGGIDYHGVSRIVEAFLPVPRSVKRLSAALLDYRLGVQDGMEMDALDYLFLEAVRHFDMGVYNELSRAVFFSYEYCGLNSVNWHSGEKVASERLAWVVGRFGYTIEKYAHTPEVLDAIHFFTGFVFSEKQENVGPQGYRTVGSKMLTYIASKEKNQAGRKLFRAYLARCRDEGEVSRQELEAFASIKDADALESYLQGIELPRVESLLEDLSNGWNVIFQNTSSKDFILAWSYALQRNLSMGVDYFYGVDINRAVDVFLNLVVKDFRDPLGWSSNAGDAVIRWLSCGNLDSLLYKAVLGSHFLIGFSDEKREVVAKLSGEHNFSKMLAGDYFLEACKVIRDKSESEMNQWLHDLDVDCELSDYQIGRLANFLASDFVAMGHADALIQHQGFQQMLQQEERLQSRPKGDRDLWEGINRLTGVA